jgi:hypothetical protein
MIGVYAAKIARIWSEPKGGRLPQVRNVRRPKVERGPLFGRYCGDVRRRELASSASVVRCNNHNGSIELEGEAPGQASAERRALARSKGDLMRAMRAAIFCAFARQVPHFPGPGRFLPRHAKNFASSRAGQSQSRTPAPPSPSGFARPARRPKARSRTQPAPSILFEPKPANIIYKSISIVTVRRRLLLPTQEPPCATTALK